MSGPTRFRAPLPDVTRLPRVGRLRLGEKVGNRPKSVDFFRVDEDESGITSAEAAAAFHQVYGNQPKTVRIQIVGHTIDDVLDHAYRLYGKGGLKRQCQGPDGMCSAKTATGAWEDKPCICTAEGRDPTSETRDADTCELSWSFQFLLPDVSSIGVWDLASSSTMSRDAIVGFLQLMLHLRGSIALLECDMRVVMKTGRAGSLVPTVELRAYDATPRQMLDAAREGTPVALPELPAGALDTPEPTIHRAGFEDPPPAAGDSAPMEPGAPATPAGENDEYLLGILRDNVTAQITFLSPALKTRLKAVCAHYGAKPTRDGLIAAWGDRAADLEKLVNDLETDMNAELQGELPIEDAEVVS